MKRKECCVVAEQTCIAPDIWSMWIESPAIAAEARPGQFLSLYCEDKSRLLPRPISICEIDRGAGRLRMVYRVAGAGTREFSRLSAGDTISVLGPLGNGFPLEEAKGKRALLLGGGIGVPPMLATAQALGDGAVTCAGYRDALFLTEEFREAGTFSFATEDGSAGVRGNVLDAVRANSVQADLIFACGPAPMLRAVKAYGEERGIPCWISMEERMACGIGACLACVCASKEVDSHSQVRNKRVCKDGPVFPAGEIEL